MKMATPMGVLDMVRFLLVRAIFLFFFLPAEIDECWVDVDGTFGCRSH